jgi:hypothetical protein
MHDADPDGVAVPVRVPHDLAADVVLVLVAVPHEQAGRRPQAEADEREAHDPARHLQPGRASGEADGGHGDGVPDGVADAGDEPAHAAPLARRQLGDGGEVVGVEAVTGPEGECVEYREGTVATSRREAALA